MLIAGGKLQPLCCAESFFKIAAVFMLEVNFRHCLAALLIGLCSGLRAMACPKIDRLADFNCDLKVKIAVTGDSIVKGVGDTAPQTGGYVARLAEHYPDVKFSNLGVGGITSGQLFRSFHRKLNQQADGATKRKIRDADLVIIDVGRNDFWVKATPSQTKRNISRLASFLKGWVKSQSGVAPLISVSTLLPTTRLFQKHFLEHVNQTLLASTLPVDIRVDELDTSYLSYDGLHPDGLGYDEIATVDEAYLSRVYNDKVASIRTDNDSDGVYDNFERSKFGTDPAKADTDGDGVPDGVELFTNHTDALDPQSH